MNNIKCQNLVIFSFKIRMNFYYHQTKCNEKKQISTILSLFYCLYTSSISLLVQLLQQQNIVTILESTTFRGAPVIRGQALISFWIPKVVALTAQKMKFSIKDFFNKRDQILRKLRIWSHLLKKSLIFCTMAQPCAYQRK